MTDKPPVAQASFPQPPSLTRSLAHLSPELLHTIFSYLPIPSLTACESICRLWRSLIQSSPHLWPAHARSQLLPTPHPRRPPLIFGETCHKDLVRKSLGWSRRWAEADALAGVDEEVEVGNGVEDEEGLSLSGFGESSGDEDEEGCLKSISAIVAAAYAYTNRVGGHSNSTATAPLMTPRGQMPVLPEGKTRSLVTAISHRINAHIIDSKRLWVSQEKDDGWRYGTLDLSSLTTPRVRWRHWHGEVRSGRSVLITCSDASKWMAAPLDHEGRSICFFDPRGEGGETFRWNVPTPSRYIRVHVRGDKALLVRGLTERWLEYHSVSEKDGVKRVWGRRVDANETVGCLSDDAIAVMRYCADSSVSIHSTHDGSRLFTVSVWRRGITDVHLTRTHLILFNESHRRVKGICGLSHRILIRALNGRDDDHDEGGSVDLGRAGILAGEMRCEAAVAADESGFALLTGAMRSLTFVEPPFCGGRRGGVNVVRKTVPMDRFTQIGEVGMWVLFRDWGVGGREGEVQAAWVVLDVGET
ncbi:hypothetical protein HDU67_004302 [Dinochytrium kinnereticum]|nr:hypothetical protein HDU67_004302 [Dinochytrium kinnereticum]